MNGFADHGLSEEHFGEKKGISVKAFDAFPKTKPTYLTRSRSGGAWTFVLIIFTFLLTLTELRRWFIGETTHTFSVEKGVSHQMQLNMDIVVAMHCSDLHVNVQDASGDRILAGEALTKDDTSFSQWGSGRNTHQLGDDKGSIGAQKGVGIDEDVHDYLGAARRKRKFPKTPRLKGEKDACRIYGSMEANRVQGDFHITARGHGYMELGAHLDHNAFNFSHQINELSFGPYIPSLVNPLDNTLETTDTHFFKFQYYLSIVPTVYTTDPSSLIRLPSPEPHTQINPLSYSSRTVYTNQYAVTEQSHAVGEQSVPGIFVKYDIEPILLIVSEEWGGFLALLIRLVNVVSGVIVAGGWCWQLWEWSHDAGLRGRKTLDRRWSEGVLHGRTDSKEDFE